jgi:hypothetical protein
VTSSSSITSLLSSDAESVTQRARRTQEFPIQQSWQSLQLIHNIEPGRYFSTQSTGRQRLPTCFHPLVDPSQGSEGDRCIRSTPSTSSRIEQIQSHRIDKGFLSPAMNSQTNTQRLTGKP